MTPTKSDLSIIDLFALALRYKFLVIGLTFLGAVAGVAIGMAQDPVYRSEALLSAVEKPNDRSAGLAGLAQQVGGLAGAINLGGTGSNKDVAIAVLRSRAFIINFIREREIEKILFADILAPDGESWLNENGRGPTDSDIFELFTRQVFAVREDNKTGLISVSVEWFDPALAADWANDIVAQINTQLRDRARDRAQNSIEYLESESTRVSHADTQRAIFNLIAQQINEIMLANVTEEYAFEVIDPAVVSDSDDYVKPRKVFLLATGIIAGFLLAITLLIGRELWHILRSSGRAAGN